VYSYRINSGQALDYALVARDGFSVQLSDDRLKSREYFINSSILTIDKVGDKATANDSHRFHVSFIANANEDGAQELTISQHNKTAWSGVVETGTRVEFDADDLDALKLVVPGYYNTPSMYLGDMSVTQL
jgi:hypothetical protein